MSRQISDSRKTAYYFGGLLQIVGALSFLSTFVTFAMHFGDFSNFAGNAKSGMFRAFGGMALIVIGGLIRKVGARGLAGSGIILDPQQARQELEPYSRMAGGMVKDVLDEADVDLSRPGEKSPTQKVIMIRCATCRQLNEEDSKFCQECGKPI